MADPLPDWLLALMNQRGTPQGPAAFGPTAFDPSNPQTGGGLLAGAMTPDFGGLLTGRSAGTTSPPTPVPVDQSVDDDSNPNTPIRSAGNVPMPVPRPPDLGQGQSVAQPPPDTNVIGTAASGTTEASSPGVDWRAMAGKAADLIGGIYGAGGPGDPLIAMGLSNRTGGASVQALNAASAGKLNQAKLAAFNLQVAQAQQNQNATRTWLQSQTDPTTKQPIPAATIDAAISSSAAGQPELLNNLIKTYSAPTKEHPLVVGNKVISFNPDTPSESKVVMDMGPDTRPLTEQERIQRGLPDGSYEVDSKNHVSPVGGVHPISPDSRLVGLCTQADELPR